MRYIFKTKNHSNTINKKKKFFLLKTFLIITPLLLLQLNCSKKEAIYNTIDEINFVTKKDAYLYNDILEKNIIDEVPAFVKIKTTEKGILINKSENDKTYYKIIFNGKEGWIESIYLADLNKKVTKKNKPLINNPNNIIKSETIAKSKEKTKTPKVEAIKKDDKNYYIQIASFKNENNALSLINKLKKSNIASSIEKINSNGNVFYRVKTSFYKNKNKANEASIFIKRKHSTLNPLVRLHKNNKKRKPNKKLVKKNGKTEYYTIQISSFKDKNTAKKLADKLSLLGYPCKVTEAWINEKAWFRVQHGEYKMIAKANQVSNTLKNKYKFNPWISNIYK